VFVSTYIEELGCVASLAATLPLAGQVVDGAAVHALDWLHRRRCLRELVLLLLCGGLDGLRDGLRSRRIHLMDLSWLRYGLAETSR